MNYEELTGMKLHEIRDLPSGQNILRVLGGWIYTTAEQVWIPGADGRDTTYFIPTSVFVPEVK